MGIVEEKVDDVGFDWLDFCRCVGNCCSGMWCWCWYWSRSRDRDDR